MPKPDEETRISDINRELALIDQRLDELAEEENDLLNHASHLRVELESLTLPGVVA